MLEFLHRFQNIDRRWIFLVMGIAIVGPMLVPIRLPFAVDESVERLYNAVEKLEPGDTVFISADFDPASKPELGPFYRAHLHHLFRKDVKVVMATLWEFAPNLVEPLLEEIAALHGKEYGKDYVFLGYKAGKELAIKSIGENIPETFPKDSKGKSTSEVPVMKGFKQAKDFALITSVSAGFPGTREYVLQIQGQYNLPIISACTAVSGPDYVPFYKADQLLGLSAGMPGSAQYEKLVFPKGPDPEGPAKSERLLATQAINVLNLAHAFIILLILLGNVAFFVTRRAERTNES